MSDLISRQAAIEHIEAEYQAWGDEYDVRQILRDLEDLPSAQLTLNGYDIEHLELIANVLRKENLPPERITEVFMDIGRIIAMVRDEFEETLRKAVERCKI